MELICIKILKEEHGADNNCIGRKETACCVECRKEREDAAKEKNLNQRRE